MSTVRVAVIGHVEWVEHARLHEPLERGAILQLHDTFEEPAGGGGVAARALPSLGAETRFFTALGSDAAGEESERVLRADGCDLRVARRRRPAGACDHARRAGRRAHDPAARGQRASGDLAIPWTGTTWRASTASSTRATIPPRWSRPGARASSWPRRVGSRAWSRAACRSTCWRARRAIAVSATTWPISPCARASASGPRAPTAATTWPRTAARAAGRPSARRGRSSTPTAPATSSWRRSRSSWRAGAGATRRSRWPRAPSAAQLTRRGGGPS